MNSSKYKSRLGLKFTSVAAIALIISFSVFLLLYKGVTWWFLYGSEFDTYWTNEGTAAVESFQAYVKDNEMTIDEAIRDVKWEKTYRTAYLYLGSSPTANIPDEGGDTQTGIPVTCSDGVIYAYAYPSVSHYDSLGIVISLGIAAICFFLILIPYVYRIIHRITHLSQEMEILTGGDLAYHIVSPGEDELAELGRSIEGMRLSVIEQMARENEAVLANSRLITSLSHDLRTPLTKLSCYLEILRYKKYQDASEAELYLSRAIEKTQQMKDLSNEMFRHFQVKVPPKENLDSDQIAGELLLSQILSEMCFDLQAEGFQANLPVIDGEFGLSVPVFELQRIFDNLFSNIRKYADSTKPVTITVSKQTSEVGVMISNYRGQCSCADSTGIGLPTVRKLVEQNGGRFNITESSEIFCVKAFFPITKNEETNSK
ncbi:MAG: HAMP domain-containing sensor histidine kinase [Oscillospiraceae bacterium]|nr:HAMP domain-containing sensor histidine kinase [Oscillospiraceae bacterium]